MNTQAVIYMLTAPNGKVYIGQTSNFKHRMSEYRRGKCKAQVKIYHSILKYGFDNFKIDILESVDKVEDFHNELNRLEVFYIAKYNSVDNGLNISHGGNGVGRHSESTRKKISDSAIGHTRNLGFKHSDETKKRTSERQIGRVLSEETKRKISEAHIKNASLKPVVKKPKRKPVVKKPKRKPKSSKEVAMYDANGTLIEIFESFRAAARKTNLYRGTVSDIVNGKTKTSESGLIFKLV